MIIDIDCDIIVTPLLNLHHVFNVGPEDEPEPEDDENEFDYDEEDEDYDDEEFEE